MKKFYLIIAAFLFLSCNINAQNYDIVSSNGQTVIACTGYFLDNGTGNYAANQNLSVTFASNSLTNTHISISFISFNVDPSDTLYVYDGPGTTSPLIGKYNNSNPLTGGQNMLQASINNPTGNLTFKFVSNASAEAAGWNAGIICALPCQKIIASFDTILTTPRPNDSNYIDICLGKSITFAGNGIFPQNDSVYHQSNATSTFIWDFGDGTIDTGMVVTKLYTQRRGYDIMLRIIDNLGCMSSNAIGARVRISSRPTTIIQPLADMCSGNTKIINVGYNPNSVILVEPMGFTQTSKQGFDSTLFLPDGPACLPGIYNTFVVFNNFPPGATLQSANDILAICVKMEHSFAGDLGFRISCPGGQIVSLDPNTHSGGAYMGEPYGGANHGTYDSGCLPANNLPGVGWTYCWSELYPNNNTTFDQLSSSAGAGTVLVNGNRTIDSTNQTSHLNYIKPQNPLSGLVGCPLNGTWNIEIKDDYGIDNGYIFGWNLELTANLMPNNWTYDVKIDSVGFAGPFITPVTDTTAIIAPTTGGNYTYNISLVDEFGCAWDTTTTMKVITTPRPYLGADTSLCYPNSIVLDPGNISANYAWLTPNGPKSTQSILTDTVYATIPFPFNYILTATNSNLANTLFCSGLDTILVTINPMPEISFSINDPYLTIGCEPLTVSFHNESTPSTSSYIWDFGDGQTSTTEHPIHIFNSGNYTIGLSSTTVNGCTKSWTSLPSYIVSYPQPISDFTWNPPIGTRQNPMINFTNLTTPNDSSFSWNWDFGDGGSDLVKNPVHEFPKTAEEKEYDVTMISLSDHGIDNLGNAVKCSDTSTYKVKIIDDILIFPNIITPNGDGKYDKFEIGALIKGGGYTEAQLIIYNRWGKKVYESNNYKNDFGGEGLADGVYFVTIKAKGLLKDIEYKSSLQILR